MKTSKSASRGTVGPATGCSTEALEGIWFELFLGAGGFGTACVLASDCGKHARNSMLGHNPQHGCPLHSINKLEALIRRLPVY